MDDLFIKELKEKQKRRSDIIWSKLSITGYIWDILRNCVVVVIILSIYEVVYEPTSIIIVSLLIFIYLAILSAGAHITQVQEKFNIIEYNRYIKIIEKLGEKEPKEDRESIEETGFLLEKMQYKFILNSVFNGIVFLIAFLNLIGVL